MFLILTLPFMFFLLQNQKTERQNRFCLGVGVGWHQWEQGGSGERDRRMNLL
jgi:hypothetical protein